MQYVGGKQKSGGQHIAAIIREYAARYSCARVREAGCGGLSVTSRLRGLDVDASDACRSLITLYQEMRAGWVPPADVDRETWERYRLAPDDADPMTAFVGFGCSRSGAWFSSFVADYKYTNRRVPAAVAARDSLRKKLTGCERVTFTARGYEETPLDGVIYFDKPYEGTLGYPAVGPFDHDAFWDWARDASSSTPILVSERIARPEFVALAEWSIQSRLSTPTRERRVERVFVHERWVR